jgi:(R)-2-hydroxyacyl-CoA dehydratese activating ATPase
MITAGFDIGTRFIKVCLVKNSSIISYEINEPHKNISEVIKETYLSAVKKAKINRKKINKKIATGYGSNLVKKCDFTLPEFPCLARAAFILDREIRTVIDIGNLFINVTTIDQNGHLDDSVSNPKCAAGSGKFLEIISEALEIPFNQISNNITDVTKCYNITSSCAVFAESEIISQINLGVNSNDILAGVIKSIVLKTSSLLDEINAMEKIALVGGVSSISEFKNFFESITKKKTVIIPINPQIVAAYGAALIAQTNQNKYN